MKEWGLVKHWRKLSQNMLKYCPKCKEEKPSSEFYSDSRRLDGLKGHCKICHSRVCMDTRDSEKAFARQRLWQSENRARTRETALAWAKQNPGIKNAANARRRALRIGQNCKCCTDFEFREIYDFTRVVGMEVDHRIPLALGGLHCVSNLQVILPGLNQSKGANLC